LLCVRCSVRPSPSASLSRTSTSFFLPCLGVTVFLLPLPASMPPRQQRRLPLR
jgi:hypothetical protein